MLALKAWLSKSLIWVAGIAIAAALWFYADAQLTKKALVIAEREAAGWQALSEAQERAQQREDGIRTVVERHVTEIERAPNANDPVPTDVAVAWANSIDSVRDEAHSRASGPFAELLGPRGAASIGGRPDGGEAKHVLRATGSRVPAVQRAARRSSKHAPPKDGEPS